MTFVIWFSYRLLYECTVLQKTAQEIIKKKNIENVKIYKPTLFQS